MLGSQEDFAFSQDDENRPLNELAAIRHKEAKKKEFVLFNRLSQRDPN